MQWPSELVFNPHDFIYPSLYMYVMFFVYGLSYGAGRLTGVRLNG